MNTILSISEDTLGVIGYGSVGIATGAIALGAKTITDLYPYALISSSAYGFHAVYDYLYSKVDAVEKINDSLKLSRTYIALKISFVLAASYPVYEIIYNLGSECRQISTDSFNCAYHKLTSLERQINQIIS